ncbi:MAG: hypothetical protein AAF899_11280 [Pseudomonadota bacterium]
MTGRPRDQEPLVLTSAMRVAVGQERWEDHGRRRPAPFSLRLLFEDGAQLEEAAAGMPLGTYILEKLFGGDPTPRRTRKRHPVKNHDALAEVLGALGQSRLSSNLNQLAQSSHLGALPVTPQLEQELEAACAEIRGLKSKLMKALGYAAREEDA